MGTKENKLVTSLFPGTKRKILALFFLNSDQEYYFSEVVRLTKTRQGVVQRELKSLTEAGLLKSEKRGRQKYYSANKANPIYVDLRNIVFKTFGAIGQIQKVLEPLKEKIKLAFIYGSFARGEETSKSDIDLFAVTSLRLDQLISLISDLEESLSREINPYLITERELKRKLQSNNHFIKSVLDSDKEFITGTEDDLRELANK